MAWGFVDSMGRAALRARGARSRLAGGVHSYSLTGGGSLPPLVLLHGIGASGLAWGTVAWHLRREASTLFIPDLPAHGFSQNPGRLCVAGIFDALAPALAAELSEPAILVGHSLGAVLAIRFALLHPSLVRGLLLVTPAGATRAPGALAGVQAALDVRTNAAARALLELMLVRPTWHASVMAPYIRESYSRPALRSVLDSVSVDDMLTAEELGALGPPLRLLWGAQERLLPRSDLEFYRASLPAHAEVVELDGFGHGAVLDRAELLASLIGRFASEVPGTATGVASPR